MMCSPVSPTTQQTPGRCPNEVRVRCSGVARLGGRVRRQLPGECAVVLLPPGVWPRPAAFSQIMERKHESFTNDAMASRRQVHTAPLPHRQAKLAGTDQHVVRQPTSVDEQGSELNSTARWQARQRRTRTGDRCLPICRSSECCRNEVALVRPAVLFQH